ncbi:hypothetical protein ABKN59_005028 [Abortiporus biennis]
MLQVTNKSKSKICHSSQQTVQIGTKSYTGIHGSAQFLLYLSREATRFSDGKLHHTMIFNTFNVFSALACLIVAVFAAPIPADSSLPPPFISTFIAPKVFNTVLPESPFLTVATTTVTWTETISSNSTSTASSSVASSTDTVVSVTSSVVSSTDSAASVTSTASAADSAASATSTDASATSTDASATSTDASATSTDASATSTDAAAASTDTAATSTDASATSTDASATATATAVV